MTEQEQVSGLVKEYSPDQIMKRLLDKKGAVYFNLNPWSVLQVTLDAEPDEIKRTYRRLSLLVHPDKNNDSERSRNTFTIIDNAYKMLTNEKSRAQCMEVLEEGKKRYNISIEKSIAEGGESPTAIEIDTELRKITCKIFAEMEQRRKQLEKVQQREERRKREGELEMLEEMKIRKEYNEKWEAGRDDRVSSWRTWNDHKKKSKNSKKKYGAPPLPYIPPPPPPKVPPPPESDLPPPPPQDITPPPPLEPSIVNEPSNLPPPPPRSPPSTRDENRTSRSENKSKRKSRSNSKGRHKRKRSRSKSKGNKRRRSNSKRN
jgi:DnaJ family protein C protein 8